MHVLAIIGALAIVLVRIALPPEAVDPQVKSPAELTREQQQAAPLPPVLARRVQQAQRIDESRGSGYPR